MTVATSISESILSAQVTHADGSVDDLGIINYWAADPAQHAAGQALMRATKKLLYLTKAKLPLPPSREHAQARQYLLAMLVRPNTWLAVVDAPTERRAYLSPHPRVLGVEIPLRICDQCEARGWLMPVPEWGEEIYGAGEDIRVTYWTLSPAGRAELSVEGTLNGS